MKISNIFLVLFISSILYSCEKSNPADPDKPVDPDNPTVPNNPTKPDTVYSSQKQIQSVVFRSADNPSLAYDISGIVSADTVKFLFEPNTAINKLVPDISFKGK